MTFYFLFSFLLCSDYSDSVNDLTLLQGWIGWAEVPNPTPNKLTIPDLV
jgi:hypothetical protein